MKIKILSIALVLTMLLCLLPSCNAKTGTELSTYLAVSYNESGLNTREITTKSSRDKRSGNIFGHEYTVSYARTVKFKNMPYAVDEYAYVVNDDSVLVTYKDDSFLIVEYSIGKASGHSHTTPVNASSPESDVIAYAKNVLSSYAGAFTEGWDVRVDTYLYDSGNREGFVSAAKNKAEYTVTFSKKIGEIERGDKMHVTMTNMGEIISFRGVSMDDSYAPYNELNITRKKIEEATWRAAADLLSKENIISQSITDIRLEVTEDTLWAVVGLKYTADITEGAVEYAIKIATLN